MRSIRTALAACAAALAVSPGAPAADFTFVSGNGAPPGRDALNQFSTDGGATWQQAFIVPKNQFYSKLPGSEWISVSASSSSPNAHTRYRRAFDLPAGCQGATLTVRVHVDNEATAWLNGTQFGATPVGERFATFQDPAEGPYTTAGPFLPAGNVLEFRVRNYSGPTALDYVAVLSCALDATAPTVSCTPPADRWHADNVSVECTAADSDSGLANPADASFALTTSVVEGTETAAAVTGSRQVCDRAGNCATAGPVTGIKIDRLAPSLTTPADLVVNATSAAGAEVAFAVAAQDGADPAPSVACEPASGSVFAIGTTIVRCTATDHVGNSSRGSFSVRVKGADEQLDDLAERIGRLDGPHAVQLQKELERAAADLLDGRLAKACASLEQFEHNVRKLSAAQLDEQQLDAGDLADDAIRIRIVIGCALRPSRGRVARGAATRPRAFFVRTPARSTLRRPRRPPSSRAGSSA